MERQRFAPNFQALCVKALVTQHWIEIDVAMLLAELHFGLVLLRNRQALSHSMYIVITIYNIYIYNYICTVYCDNNLLYTIYIPFQHCSPNKKGAIATSHCQRWWLGMPGIPGTPWRSSSVVVLLPVFGRPCWTRNLAPKPNKVIWVCLKIVYS